MGKIESGGCKYFIQEDTDFDTFLVLLGDGYGIVLGSYATRTLALEAIRKHSDSL